MAEGVKKRMLETILYLGMGLAFLNGWMYLQQPSMIFFPYTAIDQTPADWGLGYEEVFLDTEDGLRLHGWYIPAPGSTQALIFFHGNAGNISHRGESVAIFHQLGLNVLIPDYRGYGRSQGKPAEDGLYKDARAAWEYMSNEQGFAPEDIILFGRSLGGAVAAELATHVQPGGLILESTFSSANDMANVIFPVLSRLILIRYRFDVVSHIKRVSCPLLVLHSPRDEIIPFRLGEKIFKAATKPKYLVRMKGDHNSGFLESQPEYGEALGTFVSAVKQ